MLYTLRKETTFDAAHYLPGYKGKCSQLHGHTWKVIVQISSLQLNEMSMVFDFSKIKEIVQRFDHRLVNDFVERPTAENIASYILKAIRTQVPGGSEITGICVEVCESPGASITVEEKY